MPTDKEIKITCEICSRIIEEEAHYCEVSDCPHKNLVHPENLLS